MQRLVLDQTQDSEQPSFLIPLQIFSLEQEIIPGFLKVGLNVHAV
jgi:hypothetical protein